MAHFRAIAEASDRPIIVYNIPQRCVVNIEPETIVALAEIASVTAVKQATTDLEQARRIVDDAGLDLYAGNDDLILPFLELGGVGGVCVFTHLVGPQVKEKIRRFKSGDRDARPRDRPGGRAGARSLEVTTNPIPVKAALAMAGWDVGGLRLPLLEATDEEKAAIRAGLERAALWRPHAEARPASGRSAPRARMNSGPLPQARSRRPPPRGHDRPRVQIAAAAGSGGAARRMARCRPEQHGSSPSAVSAKSGRT